MEREILDTQISYERLQPRSRLVSIVEILRLVASLSEGALTVSELADALVTGATEVYDADTMMIYPNRGHGLSEPITSDTTAIGYNERVYILCEIYNCAFWNNPGATILTRPYGGMDVEDLLVLKEDGVEIARRLWKYFYPSQDKKIDESVLTKGISTNPSEEKLGYSTPHIVILNAAIAEFFEERKERDAKKDEVVDWIKTKMTASGMADSDNIAQAMFTIIKPSDHDPKKRRG